MEPERALEALADIGVRRILTAGPAENVWNGRVGLARWIEKFGKTFSFVVSGGMQFEHLPTLVPLLKAHEHHFGSAARTQDIVDVQKVARLREAIGRS